MESLAKRAVRKLTKPISREIHRLVIFDNNPDHRAAILLAGSGRSGTTWVSRNIINYNNEYRYMFEPFHPARVAEVSHFRNRQYIRPDNKDEKYLNAARAIFTGQVRNKWTDRHNTKFVSDKRLIKDIRVNLALKWIQNNFPGMPIILLFRHPCAVASSEIQQKWLTWTDELAAQPELMEDYLYPFSKQIHEAKDVFDKHVFLWCMENYVALKQFRKGEIHLAFYENFCVNPHDEIKKMFDFLGKKNGSAEEVNLDKSASKGFHTRHPDKESLINGWRKHVTEDQTNRAMEILSLFGLDKIYTKDLMPNAEGAYDVMMKFKAA